MLKKITIKNFKNIENKTFDLTGNILISGENGSGKTSLLQAIRLCTTDSLQEKLSDYIMWGKSEFEIILFFDIDNVDYKYSFNYKDKVSSKKSLTWNKEELKGSDASSKLKQLFSSNLLLYSSISEQGQSYSILLDSPTERLETFKSILSIDKVGEAIDKMKEDLKELKTNSDMMKKEKELLESKTFDLLPEFELPNIEQIKSNLLEQETEKEKKEKNDRVKQEYEILLSEYQKKLTRKEELESLIDSIRNKINSFPREEYKESEYLKLREENWTQETNLKNYKHSLVLFSNYEKQKETLLLKLLKLETEKRNIELVKVPELSFDKESFEIDQETLNSLQLKFKEVENHLKLIEQGKCPTCGQSFENTSLKDLVLERNGLQTEINEFKKAISEKQLQLKENEKLIKYNELENSKLDSLTKQIVDLNYELNDLQEVSKPEEITIDASLPIKLTELEQQKVRYEEYQKNISTFNKKLIEYESELKNITLIEQPIKPVLIRTGYDEVEYKRLQKEINIYEQKVSELERIQTHNNKIENDKKENQELIKQKDLIYYNIQEEIRVLEQSKNLLDKQYSSYLIKKGTEFVEKQMNIFFQKCYPKYEVFFKQTDNKKSIDFYYSNGKDNRFYSASLCSGFEKQLLAMAFRVALASITNVGFLILDEIDSDASESNSINLYSNLLESKLFNQIICITHKEETKNVLMNDFNARLIEMESVKVKEEELEVKEGLF